MYSAAFLFGKPQFGQNLTPCHSFLNQLFAGCLSHCLWRRQTAKNRFIDSYLHGIHTTPFLGLRIIVGASCRDAKTDRKTDKAPTHIHY